MIRSRVPVDVCKAAARSGRLVRRFARRGWCGEGRGGGLLAEGLDELVLDADDLHVGDGLARSPGLEVAFLICVDEGVLGGVLRLADRA
jgi:hypothetical protein